LARSHWGGIYNWEMKQLMLRHAFRFVNSVIFSCWSTQFALAEFILSPDTVRTYAVVEREGHRSQERVGVFVAYLCNALFSPK